MDAAVVVLEKVKSLGVTLTQSGDKLLLEPGSKVPADLVSQIREHKTEMLAHLSKPKLVDGPPQWHAETIAQAVQQEGVCIFWSELFREMIAFIRDDSFKNRVPCSLVSYTSQELLELSRKDLSEAAHRLIHEAKKAGDGRIIGHEPKR